MRSIQGKSCVLENDVVEKSLEFKVGWKHDTIQNSLLRKCSIQVQLPKYQRATKIQISFSRGTLTAAYRMWTDIPEDPRSHFLGPCFSIQSTHQHLSSSHSKFLPRKCPLQKNMMFQLFVSRKCQGINLVYKGGSLEKHNFLGDLGPWIS